jgi:fumarate hydratase class II
LGIGGTAVGTGLNTGPRFKKAVIEHINKLTGCRFRSASNMIQAMQSFDAVVDVAGSLRVLIIDLLKIADDLRLLSSGPRTGLAEIQLPGKVNPVLA